MGGIIAVGLWLGRVSFATPFGTPTWRTRKLIKKEGVSSGRAASALGDGQCGVASSSQMGRFETKWLATAAGQIGSLRADRENWRKQAEQTKLLLEDHRQKAENPKRSWWQRLTGA